MLQDTNTASASADNSRLIEACGLFWKRSDVIWTGTPQLWGYQEKGSPIDYCERRGVYILYDNDRFVYVGRSTEQGIGKRLKQHHDDRSKDPWDEFSWLVTRNATELEAVLIGVIPVLKNLKEGDGMKEIECTQISLEPLLKQRDEEK